MITGLFLKSILIFLGFTALSLAITGAVLILLPGDYLIREQAPWFKSTHGFLVNILLNLLSICLFIAGIIMLFTPGQGLLTILLSLIFISFPSKQTVLKKLLTPEYLDKLNQLRAKFNRRPLLM